MTNVYVVQNHLRYDPDLGELVPRYDLHAAERFGTLRYLLTPTANVERPAEVIAKMDLILASYSDQDYLLLIGNPALIGWATAIAAAHNQGRITLLTWSGKLQAYKTVKCCLPIQHRLV